MSFISVRDFAAKHKVSLQCGYRKKRIIKKDNLITDLGKIITEHNVKIYGHKKSGALLTEEIMKLSEQLRTLSDEISERDGKIEILETDPTEQPKKKRLWG